MSSDDIKFIDFPMYKEVDKLNGLQIKYGNDSYANALIMFLLCDKKEHLRSTNKYQGILYNYLGKSMTNNLIKQMKVDVYNALSNFTIPLTIVDLTITPNYEQNYYTINIVGYNEEHNLGVNTNFEVNN